MRNSLNGFMAGARQTGLLVLPLALLLSMFGLVNVAVAEERSGPFLVLYGAPGSEKSANASYISEKYAVPHIDISVILQEQIAEAIEFKSAPGSKKPGIRYTNAWNERNKHIQAVLKKLKNGELISDNVVNTAVLARLLEDDCKNGFVLDGYPGSVEQAVFLDALLMSRDIDSLQVILLDVTDEIALNKLAELGKKGIRKGVPDQILAVFRSRVTPLLEYYDGDSLQVVDASQGQPAVQADIDSVLGK